MDGPCFKSDLTLRVTYRRRRIIASPPTASNDRVAGSGTGSAEANDSQLAIMYPLLIRVRLTNPIYAPRGRCGMMEA